MTNSDTGNGDRLPHGLAVIEFSAVLRVVARFAGTSAGSRHVLALRPSSDPARVRARLEATDEMVSLVLARDWYAPQTPEVGRACSRLTVEGSVLDEGELLDFARLLAASRLARGELDVLGDASRHLTELAGDLVAERRLEDRLQGAFNAAGELADSASPLLRRIRNELRGGRDSLVKRLESFARSLPERMRVADASVTIRSGRYCIPVRREGASRVGGIVHDESATHQTLFVEPPLAIEEMNRLAALERDEVREVRRILAELTEILRPLAPRLSRAAEVLAELDSLNARARYALAHGGHVPELESPVAPAPIEIVEGVHPLLLEAGEPPVRFSLRMEADERVLLISGPNAGGKTVTLKTVGLLSALAQSGVVPPVGAGTRLPVFDAVYALIGDEQSISASLSTFSARLAGLAEILENAGPSSLVLLDEFGGGTDPAEGAALAAAVLLRLGRSTRLTIATTHLGALKDLAAESDAVVNASLQFDAERLRPSFVLRRDRPGRSYALEIAERLGLPPELLAEARERLTESERRLDDVLSGLETAEAEQRRLATRAGAGVRAVEARSRALDARERELAAREREADAEARARRLAGKREAESFLKEARTTVEDVIRRLREESADDGDADRQARRAVEKALRDVRGAIERDAATGAPGAPPVAVDPGDRVRAVGLGVTGDVIEVRADDVVLEARGLRITVPLSSVERLEARPRGSRTGGAGEAAGGAGSAVVETTRSTPGAAARPEVDLRGLRADEIERPLMAAIDAAIVADLGRLVVIHGKGTGALRAEVARLIEADARQLRSRPGGLAEGGSGVTVVELNDGPT